MNQKLFDEIQRKLKEARVVGKVVAKPATVTASGNPPGGKRFLARVKSISSTINTNRQQSREYQADTARAKENPMSRAQVGLKRFAEKNPQMAGRIIQAGNKVSGIAKGALRGAVIPMAKKFDTRLKDGSAMAPGIKKIFKEYYR
jgi:hypothetical protein